MAAPSKNHRYPTNVQVAIDADTRLLIATGDPQPGNRNDCTVYRESDIDQQLAGRPVVADNPVHGQITDRQEEPNVEHRRVRARVEHAIGQTKTWKSSATTAERPPPSLTQYPESRISATSHSSANAGDNWSGVVRS